MTKDYRKIPMVQMKDYYKALDTKAKAEAEEHRRRRSALKNNTDDNTGDINDGDG